MHPNLSAAVTELQLLAILAGIMVCVFLSFFFMPDCNSPLRKAMHGMVTIVIEVIKRHFWIRANSAVNCPGGHNRDLATSRDVNKK